MNRERVARRLVAIAKELISGKKELTGVKVMDVARYMQWAQEDTEPLKLMVHSLRSRINNAVDATLDRKALQKLSKLTREVDNLEKTQKALERAIGELT